jgi:hypothetical protein
MSGIVLISSGLPSGSDVADAAGIRGLMTQSGHLGVRSEKQLESKIGDKRASDSGHQRRLFKCVVSSPSLRVPLRQLIRQWMRWI